MIEMGKASGNHYKLRKQYYNAIERINDLEEQLSALKRDLRTELTRDHNQIIAKLAKKVRSLLKESKQHSQYVENVKTRCKQLITIGFLHRDLYNILFDEEMKMDDASKLPAFGFDIPDDHSEEIVEDSNSL